MAEAIRGAKRHVHVCSWHLEPDFDPGPRESTPGARAAGRDRRARPRAHARVGGRAGPGLPAPPRRRSRPRASSSCGARRSSAQLDSRERTDALPPREARDRRRRARVRRRHRPHRAGRRPLRRQRATRTSRTRSAGTTRRRGCADRSCADVAAHFALRWRGDAGEALPLPEAPAPAGDTTVQLVRTVPEQRVRRPAARRVLDPRELHARAARRRGGWSTSRTSSCGRPRSSTSSRPSCATRRPTTSASSSCCRTRPTTARTTRAGSSAGWSTPTTARERFLATTIMSRTGERSGPLYVHAKIGIVDDEWLAIGSANLNEHSLFNDTEVDVVTGDPALARATRLRLWAEHLEARDADGDPRQRGRRAVAPDRDRAARAPARRRAADPPPDRAAGRRRRSRRLLGPLDALVVDG